MDLAAQLLGWSCLAVALLPWGVLVALSMVIAAQADSDRGGRRR